MAKLTIKHDQVINGHEFKAGEVDPVVIDHDADGKEVKNDYTETLKAQDAAYEEQVSEANVHHGEVATTDDPNAVSEQTPTRPLPDGPDVSDPKAIEKSNK